MNKDKTYFRTISLERASLDEDNRMIPASLSSQTIVQRDFGSEVLLHTADAIDMSRADKGLPLLFSHNMAQPIGRVEHIKLDDGILRGMLRFSKNPKADEVYRDVADGILTDMSIGYRIEDYNETETGIEATRWLPYEGSVVAVPADANVGINRSEERKMSDTTETPNSGETPTGDSVVVDIQLASQRAMEKGALEGQRAERKRVSDINSIFEFHQGDQVRTLQSKCIDDGLTLVQAQRALLQMLGGQSEPLATDFKENGTRGNVSVGESGLEKTMNGLRDVLYHRAGLGGKDLDVSGNEFMGLDLSGMARESLRVRNTNMRGMSNYDIVGTAFARDVTETAFDKAVADFPALLADVANKSLLKGYNESEETWMRWCGTGSLPDFKTGNRPNLSLYPTPATVAENGAFQLADMSDWNETIALKTVGSIFSITRQAIVNDDLSAFTRIPRAQGRAAARSVGDTVYEQLTTVVTMGDTNPLFDTVNHTNVYGAGAPAVATVDEIRTGMALQQDPNAIALGIRPAYLICPLALEGVATTLRNAQFDPDTGDADGNTAGNRPNWVAGTFEVVPEHRLDANSATIWYMTASQSIYDTVEVDFLNGVNAPMLESRDGFKIDGVEMKVRLDYGVAPLDWRTMAINGAAPV